MAVENLGWTIAINHKYCRNIERKYFVQQPSQIICLIVISATRRSHFLCHLRYFRITRRQPHRVYLWSLSGSFLMNTDVPTGRGKGGGYHLGNFILVTPVSPEPASRFRGKSVKTRNNPTAKRTRPEHSYKTRCNYPEKISFILKNVQINGKFIMQIIG